MPHFNSHFNSQLEKKFYELLTRFFKEANLVEFTILHEPHLSDYTELPSGIRARPDFLILKGRYPFMIIEVISSLNSNKRRPFIELAKFDLDLIGADYFIFTDTERIKLYDRNFGWTDIDITIEDFYKIFREEPNITKVDDDSEFIKNTIINSIDQYKLEDPLQKKSIEAVKLIIEDTSVEDLFEYNHEGRFYHFKSSDKTSLEDIEHKFFQSLLRPVTEKAVCRYTTFDNIFLTLNHQTYRMASHIPMNDRGEVDYVDKYIGDYYKPLNSLSMVELKQMNNSFISSCTTIDKKDDLTMYRLYGDDSKGVCLCFTVIDNSLKDNIIIRKISYGVSPGNHPELDLINHIVNMLITVHGIRFRFQFLDIWKHFFKSSDYKMEEEVRLLFIEDPANPLKDSGWVISSPDRILSRYIMFELNNPDFPLRLEKIILGPNCPEGHLNRRQFEVLLNSKGMSGVSVELSRIDSYRKT
jgi:hypothetical protein